MPTTTVNDKADAESSKNPAAARPTGEQIYRFLQDRLQAGRIVLILPPNVSRVHIAYIPDGPRVSYHVTGVEFEKYVFRTRPFAAEKNTY